MANRQSSIYASGGANRLVAESVPTVIIVIRWTGIEGKSAMDKQQKINEMFKLLYDTRGVAFLASDKATSAKGVASTAKHSSMENAGRVAAMFLAVIAILEITAPPTSPEVQKRVRKSLRESMLQFVKIFHENPKTRDTYLRSDDFIRAFTASMNGYLSLVGETKFEAPTGVRPSSKPVGEPD